MSVCVSGSQKLSLYLSYFVLSNRFRPTQKPVFHVLLFVFLQVLSVGDKIFWFSLQRYSQVSPPGFDVNVRLLISFSSSISFPFPFSLCPRLSYRLASKRRPSPNSLYPFLYFHCPFRFFFLPFSISLSHPDFVNDSHLFYNRILSPSSTSQVFHCFIQSFPLFYSHLRKLVFHGLLLSTSCRYYLSETILSGSLFPFLLFTFSLFSSRPRLSQ